LTVLPTDPTVSPADTTFSETPRAADRACEVARDRGARGAFFVALPLLLPVEREVVLFRGLAVLGTVAPCLQARLKTVRKPT
jgi:hypothetical protein